MSEMIKNFTLPPVSDLTLSVPAARLRSTWSQDFNRM
jgi:hypothetical protein